MSSDQEEEDYIEPASFGEHQLLVNKARKIVKNARKFSIRKRKLNPKTSEVAAKKIVLVPEDPSKGVRVISLPKIMPPKATIASVSIRSTRPTSFMELSTKDPLKLRNKLKKSGKELPKAPEVDKTKVAPPIIVTPDLPVETNTIASENNSKDTSKTVWKSIREPRKEPVNFPKAIVYPEKTKPHSTSNNPSTSSSSSNSSKSFLNEFEKLTEITMKQQAVKKLTQNEFIKVPNLGIKTYSKKLNSAVAEAVRESSPVHYLIQQNLLSSQNDKALSVPKNSVAKPIKESFDYECQFEAVKDLPKTKQEQNQATDDTPIPPRPDVNLMLVENLAYYRVVARYLLNKKKIPPFDFDSTDNEYINVYRSLLQPNNQN